VRIKQETDGEEKRDACIGNEKKHKKYLFFDISAVALLHFYDWR
jgi:hypothetical protein